MEPKASASSCCRSPKDVGTAFPFPGADDVKDFPVIVRRRRLYSLEYGSGGAGIPLSPTVRRSVDESTLWRRRTGGYASGGAGRQASTEEVRRRRESFASLSPHHLSAGSIHHATGKRRCICRMPFLRAVSNMIFFFLSNESSDRIVEFYDGQKGISCKFEVKGL
ncbi:uncharacterized protein LOC119586824 [Penaeus monodon]|uniref:uncharacterized protein LOC119586824 n=1 Tax=Penaeus monodon TaxID=6687 RepID=UPI0018A741F8|nr:uncharacterized protein LOC119586824 [Penaeus monodon]